MSVGGQSNAPQTPFSPNYRERRSVQPRGPGNAYTQRPGQQPNPQQPAQLRPAPQPNQPPPGMELNPDYIEPRTGGVDTMEQRPSRFRPIQARTGTDQPPPGLTVNTPGTQNGVSGYYSDSSMSNFFPNTPAGEPTSSTMALVPATRNGVRGHYTDGSMRNFVPDTPFGGGFGGGYSNPFGGGFGGGYSSPFGGGFGGGYSTPFSDYGGGFGGGYSSPYMSPSMMGGLASLFGGMQGGGFQGMFNQQPQQQSYGSIQGNMAFDRQRMEALIDRPQPQRKPNQPPPVDKGEDDFNQQMATLSPEERANYHGTSEHRNSADTLETIRRTRQDPEWGRYYQNKSDDEIYAGMQVRAI